MSEVKATVKNRLNQDTTRYLSFHFNRVQGAGKVRHLLVTVQDISQKVDLEERLNNERLRSHKEFSMLLKAFETDPATMRSFVERSEAALLEVNDLLRTTSSASSETQVQVVVDGAFRRIHALKGDAAALGLDVLATLAHQFENELQKLKDNGATTGDALLSLPLPLEELLSKVGAFKAMAAKRPDSLAVSGTDLPEAFNAMLSKLVNDVGRDCGKKVNARVRMGSVHDLPKDRVNQVREIAIQLVRNAVVHGVEDTATRLALGKNEIGELQVNLIRDDLGEWTLSVRDDGAGLDSAVIREALVAKSWYTPAQLDSFSDKQIISHIFKPGFSTANTLPKSGVGLHAGRGVGLDVVQSNVQGMGARLLLSTVPKQYTEFKVRFAA